MLILKKIFPFVMIALFSGSAPCRADQLSISEAEKLYQSGEFEKAKTLYRSELEADASLNKLPEAFFFNYGTILARAGAPGEDYVMLLRAAFGNPFDGDIRHNLWRVEQMVPSTVRSVKPALWLGFWPRALRTLPWQAWLLVGLIFSALSLLVINASEKVFTWSFGAIAALIFTVSALTYFQSRLPVHGVISIAQVKSGPGTTFTDITSLEPGSLVNEDGSRDGWRKIRFRKGEMEETVGWVQPTVLLKVWR